jgi:transcriptional regulator with XRE-family HTH domain
MTDDNSVERRAAEWSKTFGAMIKARRRAQGLHQEQLALATGVGRRFLSELESGKSTTQLGKALLVAETLGMRLDALLEGPSQAAAPGPDLREPCDELPLEEDEDGPAPRPL